LRILQVIPYFYPAESFGGSVRVAFNIGRELARRGHEVTVFASDAEDLENRLDVKDNEIEGMKVYYFRNLTMLLVKCSKLFVTPELLKEAKLRIESFDIIHLHEYRSFQNIVLHHYAGKYSIPYVLQVEGSIPRIGKVGRKWFYDMLFGYRLLRNASKVIAVTQMEVKQYRDMGVPKEKIVLISPGIDVSEYMDLPPKGVFRAKHGISNNKKIILYLGRIHEIKGIDSLIKAYVNLLRSTKFDDVILVIAGPDDGYLSEAKSMVNSFKINNKVLFTGPIYGRSKLEAYVDANVYVLPSRYEIWGMTVMEAMACGTPVILSENCGTADVVRDKGGLVVNPSPEEIQTALLDLLTNEELARKMGEMGRRFVRENCSWNNIVPKFEALYEEVIGSC